MSLLKSHQNELFDLWQKGNLNPDDFKLIDINISDPAARIEHTKEKYYFEFERTVANSTGSLITLFSIKCAPGEHSITEILYAHDDWKSLINNYVKWLQNIVREQKQPNLWKEYLKSKIYITPIANDDNSKFNKTEISSITTKIDTLRTLLKDIEHTTSTQLDYANKQLDYISGKLPELGKADWRSIAIPAFFCIYQIFVQNPEIANKIIAFYTEHFQFLMNLPKLLGHK